MNVQLTLVIIMIISVFIKRFIPAKGFLCDETIERLTYFGDSRVIQLRNLNGYDEKDLVTVDTKRAAINTQAVQQNIQITKAFSTTQNTVSGVSLQDIKAKEYSDVNTDYMYGNIDDSDESLADTMRKGGLK